MPQLIFFNINVLLYTIYYVQEDWVDEASSICWLF